MLWGEPGCPGQSGLSGLSGAVGAAGLRVRCGGCGVRWVLAQILPGEQAGAGGIAFQIGFGCGTAGLLGEGIRWTVACGGSLLLAVG